MSYIMFGRCASYVRTKGERESARGHLYIYSPSDVREKRPREGCLQIGHTFQFYLSRAVLRDVVVYIRVKKL